MYMLFINTEFKFLVYISIIITIIYTTTFNYNKHKIVYSMKKNTDVKNFLHCKKIS